jgi:hypothetical protein
MYLQYLLGLGYTAPHACEGWRSARKEGFLARIRRIIVVALALAVLAGPRATPAAEPGAAPCELKDPDARWLQRAVDGWDMVRREFLRLEPRPLPWIVLYDSACVWHIGPQDKAVVGNARSLARPFMLGDETLVVVGQPHRGTVLLPNRVEIPIEIKASTALYRNGRAAFLVMAMPSVWRTERRHASKPHLDEYLQGVFTHELAHTRQLIAINARLRQVVGKNGMPSRLNDDVIQSTFHKDAGFSRKVNQERNLLYQAALTSDPTNMRELTRKALAMMRDRQARYFQGANASYAEMEELFLTIEGAGQWAAYRLTKARRVVGASDMQAMELVRDDRRFWSQEYGLAIYLLLDQLVPGWQERMFDALPASPLTMLEQAVGETPLTRRPPH